MIKARATLWPVTRVSRRNNYGEPGFAHFADDIAACIENLDVDTIRDAAPAEQLVEIGW